MTILVTSILHATRAVSLYNFVLIAIKLNVTLP